MEDPLRMNITGRVMLLLHRLSHEKMRAARVYTQAVLDVIRKRYPADRPSLLALEPLITEQLVLVESALRMSLAGGEGGSAPAVVAEVPDDPDDFPASPTADPVVDPSPDEMLELEFPDVDGAGPGDDEGAADMDLFNQFADPFADESDPEPESLPDMVPEPAAGDAKPKAVPRKTHKPRNMEEKLKEERKPVQKLLKEDCVSIGLLTKDMAKDLVKSMLGKKPEDAEADIVAHLRQILQDQVRAYIRQHKGGPWKSPREQEDMRQDIHMARSVMSILMLARQVSKERRQWEKENGRRGVLGLFAGRKRIVND